METLNIFEDISTHIIRHIREAENAINICVPWLTDEEILSELVEKSRQKIHIEIITVNDEFNRAKTSYFNKLIANGSKVYLIDKTLQGGIPHHKFCTIDDEVLITGSYNWSNNAKNNDENILIKVITDFDEDHEIINDYNIRFNEMLYKYGIKNENDDWDEVIKYTNEAESKQKDAKQFYELASKSLQENKLNEALDFINEGIGKLPYSDKYYFWLKHIILKSLRNYVDSAENLYKYLWEIADNDFKEIEQFKQTYNSFIKVVKDDGKQSYKLIADINQKTKAKLGKFALLKIEPHFFTYEELDTMPF